MNESQIQHEKDSKDIKASSSENLEKAKERIKNQILEMESGFHGESRKIMKARRTSLKHLLGKINKEITNRKEVNHGA